MFVDAPTANILSTQVTLSALSVAVIQWLKSSSWFPWLHARSDYANRAVSLLTALATAVGIHMTWTHGDVAGAYTIGITGATLAGISSGLFAVVKSLAFNEMIYRTTVKSQAPGKPAVVLGATESVPMPPPAPVPGVIAPPPPPRP